uniref:Uncharacterized mitochondrial protein AtMg00810-like n=1 Tax=Tanacetum cinerariifolium TaxID=118510 RepID=A0A6L2JXQ7_TANCI|nr:uncharacterized mitochondrial protein AtMg00810-like [Tanacetum cinerariifolium]
MVEDIPIDAKAKYTLTDGDPLPDLSFSQTIMGSLVYLIVTRPYISYAVHIVSQFVLAPTTVHWAAVLHVLRYLRGTQFQTLLFPSTSALDLRAYFDSDWADDVVSSNSTTGFCIFLSDSPISRKSIKQDVLSKSSIEPSIEPWQQSLLSCKLSSSSSDEDLLLKVPHHGLDLWLQIQIFYEHVNYTTQMAIDYAAGGRLKKLRLEEACKTIKDLAQYKEEEWNELESPDYIDANLEHELESMGCRENQVRKLEEDMRKLKVTFMCIADSLIETLKVKIEAQRAHSIKIEKITRFPTHTPIVTPKTLKPTMVHRVLMISKIEPTIYRTPHQHLSSNLKMPILHSFKENKLEYNDEDDVKIKMMGTRIDKESLEPNINKNDISSSICHNFALTSNPPVKPKDSCSFRMKQPSSLAYTTTTIAAAPASAAPAPAHAAPAPTTLVVVAVTVAVAAAPAAPAAPAAATAAAATTTTTTTTTVRYST